MKSAEQWMDEFDPARADDHGPVVMTLERIGEIQADAIRHAAECASRIITCGGGNQKITGMLRAEAFRVGAGQPLRSLPPAVKRPEV